MRNNIHLPKISEGNNDILVSTTGQRIIDMFSANGATLLGHCNAQITAQVSEQLHRIWLTGGLGTNQRDQALQTLETFFPESHQACGLFSTGMEVAEFAMRVAWSSTQRKELIGFESCMHGKSLATAYLGWHNKNQIDLPFIHRLPFIQNSTEEKIIQHLEKILSKKTTAAVFIEPLQASGGGYQASANFYKTVYHLCQLNGTLLIFDEILTGFYRTGLPFYFSQLDFIPDIILLGKAMGNGFPVSSIMAHRRYPIEASMFPGSTFADNPLASIAALATLNQIKSLDLKRKVKDIEDVIIEHLMHLNNFEIKVRGQGILWILELPKSIDLEAIAVNIYKQGVLVSYTRNYIRILPPATINLNHLQKACSIIRDELIRAVKVQ